MKTRQGANSETKTTRSGLVRADPPALTSRKRTGSATITESEAKRHKGRKVVKDVEEEEEESVEEKEDKAKSSRKKKASKKERTTSAQKAKAVAKAAATGKKKLQGSEKKLEESGISIAPPKRSSAVVVPQPPTVSFSSRQRRSDQQQELSSSTGSGSSDEENSEEDKKDSDVGDQSDQSSDEDDEDEEEEEEEEDEEDGSDQVDNKNNQDGDQVDDGKGQDQTDNKNHQDGEQVDKGKARDEQDDENDQDSEQVDKGKARDKQDDENDQDGKKGSITPTHPSSPTDIHMESPGRQGASRTTGGIFQGHAYGNAPKAADKQYKQSTHVGPVKGQVLLYISTVDPGIIGPQQLPPTLTLKVDVSDQTIGSVVAEVSTKWTPLERNNNRVYFHDSDTNLWALSGRFSHAVTMDDPVPWSLNKDNGQYELHMMDNSFEPAASVNPSASGSVTSVPRSATTSQGELTDAVKAKLLAEILEIDTTLLRNSGGSGLSYWYKQYLACLAALDRVSHLTAAEWAHAPWSITKVDVVQCFASRGHFYSKTAFKLFEDIQKYPEMVTWLQDPDNHTEQLNRKLWGYQKPKYEWADLKSWKEQQQQKLKATSGGSRAAASGSEPSPKKNKGKGKDNSAAPIPDPQPKPKKDKGNGKDKDMDKSSRIHKKSKSGTK